MKKVKRKGLQLLIAIVFASYDIFRISSCINLAPLALAAESWRSPWSIGIS